jgi:hypothetical protein
MRPNSFCGAASVIVMTALIAATTLSITETAIVTTNAAIA